MPDIFRVMGWLTKRFESAPFIMFVPHFDTLFLSLRFSLVTKRCHSPRPSAPFFSISESRHCPPFGRVFRVFVFTVEPYPFMGWLSFR